MPPLIKRPSVLFPSQRSQIARPGTATGMAPMRPDPTIAKPVGVNAPAAPLGIDRNTESYTYITAVYQGGEAPILYNGDRQWATLELVLETAGPVVVGTRSDITPIFSGKGRLLQTNVPYRVTIAKTSRLWIVSTSVNRVAVTIAPPPWLEQIALSAQKIEGK